MANVCAETVRIYSDNEERLKDLYLYLNDIKEANRTDRHLSDLARALCEADLDIHSDEGGMLMDVWNHPISVNGANFSEIDLSSNELTVYMETRWAPTIDGIKLLCNKFLGDDQEIIFSADETFQTNDESLKGKYVLDIFGEDLYNRMGEFDIHNEYDTEFTEKQIRDLASKLLRAYDGRNTVDVLIEKLENLDEYGKYVLFDFGMSIHAWDFIDIHDISNLAPVVFDNHGKENTDLERS